jgi:hypothetical protein
MNNESSLFNGVVELRKRYGTTPACGWGSPTHADIEKALEEFQECVRYLNTRRSKGAILVLQSEADVQDAIFLMLRPWIHDLVPENPTDRVANRFAVKDFCIRSAKTTIEAKFIRDQPHGKYIFSELSADIQTYRHHPSCDNLIFFVYDPGSNIPDQLQLRTAVEAQRVYDGKALRCKLIVKP